VQLQILYFSRFRIELDYKRRQAIIYDKKTNFMFVKTMLKEFTYLSDKKIQKSSRLSV